MWGFLGCQLFRVFEPLYLHVTTGYWGDVAYSSNAGFVALNRLGGAPADIVNANQLAWLCVSVVPFLFFLLGYGGKLWKAALAVLLPVVAYALLLTGSRSGLLCLVFTIGAIVWVSQRRSKALLIACLVALPLGGWAFIHMGSDMQTRYLSIVDSTVAGGDTAQGRIDSLFKTARTISHNPLFGNGLGTSKEANYNIMGGHAQITHNLYLEVIQETGLIGFVLFSFILVAIVKALIAAQTELESKGYDRNDWLFRLILAVRVWVYMDLFYSLSCFGLRSWEWYFFGGVTTLCLVFANQREKVGAVLPELRSV
jgi:putative inorganic carbon (hco3(-)) transporter